MQMKSDQPRNLIGFLFGFAIAFWANSIATYYINGPFETDLAAVASESRVEAARNTVALIREKDPGGSLDSAIEELHKALKDEAERSVGIALWRYGKWNDAIGAHEGNKNRFIAWILTLLAGIVFLGNIVCIMWWYAMYIYKIQLTATMLTYALDFGVCAMFNIAGNKWTEPTVFLLSVVGASLLLGWRFHNLYKSHEANDTDRRILRAASVWLSVAIGICLAFLGLLVIFSGRHIQPLLDSGLLHPGLVVVLSLIGIWLTVWFREQIRVSAQIHEAQDDGSQRFIPMDLHWPTDLVSDAGAKHLVTNETRLGLEQFHALFRGDPGELDHDRLRSRVHSEGDLRVQSYILAIPSWTPGDDPTVKTDEIRNKAFMVGISHWIDDLVDGRGELSIYNKLKSIDDFGMNIEYASDTFKILYEKIITKNTNRKFFEKLYDKIENAATLPDNRKYLFFSLNRVAVGAVIFGPKIKERDRQKVLEAHNTALVNLIAKEGSSVNANKRWYRELQELLTSMRAEDAGLGKTLLGLTTKTVQEMALASEGHNVCFGRSVLYSLLYAPMLYFHDVDGELMCQEMVPLEIFDVNYDSICPWLEQMSKLIAYEHGPKDSRQSSRQEQLKMAFRCFAPNLPPLVRDAFADIYDPGVRTQQIISFRR